MANKTLFQSLRGRFVPDTGAVINADGLTYALSDEAAPAQDAVTGCLND